MKVVVATITCDFKWYSTPQVLENNKVLETPEGMEKILYLNLETAGNPDAAMVRVEKPVHYDIWRWTSAWRGERGYDQDQGHRLPAICIARNMAREFALRHDADAILYVDSDVVIPKNSIPRLWKTGMNIVGGVVPGRGAHKHTVYMGSGMHKRTVGENLVELDYATAGFVLIRKPVYRSISWRWGWTHEGKGPISEDPLFAYDAYKAGFGRWYVCTDLVAEHLDDADRPLMETAKF